MKSYEVKIIEGEDRKEILEFLRMYFMKDEPINASINLINEENPINEPLEEFLLKDLENGVSLKAVKDGALIGICVNSIIKKDQPQTEIKCDNEGFNKIMDFLTFVDEHSNPFKTFPESDKAITVGVLAVHPDCRGMGIARQLMEKTLELGRNTGCGFMTVECSSHYTARALEKLGFELIYTLKYEDYKVDGEVVFKTQPPHVASTVYVKNIVIH